jgi:hypothetical protein
MTLPARVFVGYSASRRQERRTVGHDIGIDVVGTGSVARLR